MNTDNTQIRRLANGSIDTDYYIRQCHREHSLAAHRAIGRGFNFPRNLIEKLFLRWTQRTPARNAPEPAE